MKRYSLILISKTTTMRCLVAWQTTQSVQEPTLLRHRYVLIRNSANPGLWMWQTTTKKCAKSWGRFKVHAKWGHNSVRRQKWPMPYTIRVISMSLSLSNWKLASKTDPWPKLCMPLSLPVLPKPCPPTTPQRLPRPQTLTSLTLDSLSKTWPAAILLILTRISAPSLSEQSAVSQNSLKEESLNLMRL